MLKARQIDVPFLVVSATIVDEQAVARHEGRRARLRHEGPGWPASPPPFAASCASARFRVERRNLEEQVSAIAASGEPRPAGPAAWRTTFNNLLTGISGKRQPRASICSIPSEPAPPRCSRASSRPASAAGRPHTPAPGLRPARAGSSCGPVDISTLVREISELMRTSPPQKSAVLGWTWADQLPPVEADSTQIQQLVMNLVLECRGGYR